MNDILTVVRELFLAWKNGGTKIRVALIVAFVFLFIALLSNLASDIVVDYRLANAVSMIFLIFGGVIGILIYFIQKAKEEDKNEERVEQAELRVQNNPKETQAAWDLARIKLESYLNRNLSQVRSIFWLTLLVMLIGFGFIGVGVTKAFENSENFQPALLSAVTGVLINFIGATFLVLYKSTMSQAKDYVAILERINAVGMSVQILDKLEDADSDLIHSTTADIAKSLLDLYKTTK
ncbi:MAG: hypothetical protein OCC49_19560 [Fibrobacterales bacterium]